jgi:hypothetical protein
MSVRSARRIVLVLLALYLVALTWPGIVPFNRIYPLVFGLPFVLFWITLWVLLAGVGLAFLDYVETRAERDAAPAAGDGEA